MGDPDKIKKDRLYKFILPRVFLFVFPILFYLLINELAGQIIAFVSIMYYISMLEANLNRVFLWRK